MQTSNFMSILSINRVKEIAFQRISTANQFITYISVSRRDRPLHIDFMHQKLISTLHLYLQRRKFTIWVQLRWRVKDFSQNLFSHERNNMDHSSRSSSNIRQTHYFITIRDLHTLKAVSSSTYHRWTIRKTSFKATNCRSSSKVKYEANRCNAYRSWSRDKFGIATPTKKSRFKS